MKSAIVSPESVGIPSSAILKLMRRLAKLEYLNSLILMRHGQRCAECFVAPYDRETPHQLYSMSKSFTSCAIGLAQAEGKLSIRDKLVSFFPEYATCVTDSRMNDVTLCDLLTMQSGHLECARKYCKSDNWVRDYLESPLDTMPGTTFAYNTAASYMLAAVIQKTTGENLREYLTPRLFAPLGMMPGIWESCPMGINYGGWGLYLTTDDVAKFAQLLLQHGVWNGRSILPQDYLAEATRKQSDNSMNNLPDWQQGYGYQFWRSLHGYRADGASGQYAIVLEKEDIAIATTACMPNMKEILTAIWEELLPNVSDQPLPEDPPARRELEDFLGKMTIPAAPVKITVPAGSRKFEFQENRAGIRVCSVNWNDSVCTLTLIRPGEPEQLRAGFGHFEKSTFQLTDQRAHPVAAFAEWENAHTLKISSFITDGIFRDVWMIDFNDPHEPVKNSVLCACFRPEKPRLFLKQPPSGICNSAIKG